MVWLNLFVIYVFKRRSKVELQWSSFGKKWKSLDQWQGTWNYLLQTVWLYWSRERERLRGKGLWSSNHQVDEGDTNLRINGRNEEEKKKKNREDTKLQ